MINATSIYYIIFIILPDANLFTGYDHLIFISVILIFMFRAKNRIIYLKYLVWIPVGQTDLEIPQKYVLEFPKKNFVNMLLEEMTAI